MNIYEAIILGLLQGLTEFIPVSSSGHLVIAQHFFGGGQDHLFLEWINIGTLLALLVYFWPKLMQIARRIVVDRDYTLTRNILITAVPAGAVGFMLSDFIENSPFFGSIWVVVCTLVIVGTIMVLLPKLPRLSDVSDGARLPWQRALSIGLVQMFALIPGVSRSGSTIIAGRLMGLNAREAAEYSFLASLPIMCGVILKLVVKGSDRAYFGANVDTLIIGNIVAFVSGLIAVGFLMRYLQRHELAVFGWYRIGLAAVVVVTLLATGL